MGTDRIDRGPGKIPIAHRILIALVALGGAARAEPVDEAAVVRRAAQRAPQILSAAGSVAAAEADALSASLYPNPSLSWTRETAGDESENAVSLTVPVDVSSRRKTRATLARSRAASARANSMSVRTRAVVGTLSLFYGAVAAEARADARRRTVEQLEESARVVDRRMAEGTASGLESDRLHVELELARSALQDERTAGRAMRRELAATLELNASQLSLRATLAPGTPPAQDEAPARPSDTARRRATRLAESARDRASAAWIPPLSLSGGLRTVSGGGDSATGYVVGVSIDLPLFSRGQGLEASSEARGVQARSQATRAERLAAIQRQRAVIEWRAAAAELERLSSATTARVEQLQRAAASSYREGRGSVLELVDAQRAREAVELRAVELALSSRRAQLAHRAAAGEFER